MASFVSGNARALAPFIARTQSAVLPSAPVAAKATWAPSGESTGGPARSEVSLKCVSGGGLMNARMLNSEGAER
jgi:hypothetical protein